MTVFNATDPEYTAGTLFLQAPTTTSKGWFLVYGLKTLFKWHQSFKRGATRLVQVWRIMPKSKVRKEPIVKTKPRRVNVLQLQPNVSRGNRGHLRNISGFKSAYPECPYQSSRVTFLTRRWPTYTPKQQRDTETAKVQKIRWRLCFLQNELAS